MLANMRVGTKLAAILLAPLAVLAVLAGLGVSERTGRASDLRAAEDDAGAARAISDLQLALEIESLWAVARLTGNDGQSVKSFQASIETSQDAAVALEGSLGDVRSGGVDFNDRIATVSDRLAAIDALRGDVTSGDAKLEDVLFRYRLGAQSLLGLAAATSQNQAVADIREGLGFAVTLSRARAADAQAWALLMARNGAPSSTGRLGSSLPVSDFDVELADARADSERFYAQFFADADAEFRSLLRNALASSQARQNSAFGEQILAGQAVDPVAVAGAAAGTLVELGELTGAIDAATAEGAAAERGDATRTARLYLLGAGLGILAAVGLAFLVGRSITRPLRRLARAADRISGEQLPALVSQLQAGGSENVDYEPILLNSRDEIGQLASAFNTLQQVTVDVAQQQSALLRKGIGDIFVNLARRNQALLDRQIEFIDQLEANERDPDQLENLFRLDHLATRMRRNAESLLVLAGAETTRRRGRPVALADVIRVAVGEVADYSRIRVRALDEVRVNAAVAVDLAHLLAELMENATQFSPPTTSVEVQGGFDAQGQYVISVTDRGIGIQPDQLADFNRLLAQPPLMGLEMSRSLGFVVIGRLAQRHGIVVQLYTAPIHGVTAAIRLPSAVLGTDPTAGSEPGRGHLAGDPMTPPLRVGALTEPSPPALPEPAVLAPGAGEAINPAAFMGPSVGGHGNGAELPTRSSAPNGASRVEHRVSGPGDSPESFTYYEVAEDLEVEPQMPRQGRMPLAEPAIQAFQPAPLSSGAAPPAADFTETEGAELGPGVPSVSPLAARTPASAPAPDPFEASGSDAGPLVGGEQAPPRPGEDLPVRRAASMFSSAAMAAAQASEPVPTSGAEGAVGVDRDGSAGEQERAPSPTGAASPASAATAQIEDLHAAETAFTQGLAEPAARPGHLASGLPARRSTPTEPQAPTPPARPAATPTAPPPSGNGDAMTAAGLVRRSPKQQLRAMARGEPEAITRAVPSQRSPEEVRKMLSRYRSGLQRGRTPGSDGTDATEVAAPAGLPASAPGPGSPSGALGESANGPGGPNPQPSSEQASEESPWRN